MNEFIRTVTYDMAKKTKTETMEPLAGPLALDAKELAERHPGKPVVGWQINDEEGHVKLLEDCV